MGIEGLFEIKHQMELDYTGNVPWTQTGIYGTVNEIEQKCEGFESTNMVVRGVVQSFVGLISSSKNNDYKQLSHRINFNGYYNDSIIEGSIATTTTTFMTPTRY